MLDADVRHGRFLAVLAGGAVALGVLAPYTAIGWIVGLVGLGWSVHVVRYGGRSLTHLLFWLAGAAGTTATALFAWSRGPHCVSVDGVVSISDGSCTNVPAWIPLVVDASLIALAIVVALLLWRLTRQTRPPDVGQK